MPKKFSKARPTAAWGRGILADVIARLRHPRRGSEVIRLAFYALKERGADDVYELMAMHQDNNIWWALRNDIEAAKSQNNLGFVGGGKFVYWAKPKKILREWRVALMPKHQGRGLYPRVLADLRRLLRRSLESDTSLSPANRRAWEKAEGIFNTGTRRFTINPRRMTVIEKQIRRARLVTEGAIPPRVFWPRKARQN
jgi:hypothetical protein